MQDLISLEKITRVMTSLGATRVIVKPLASNDNSKQQIYLGSDYEVIKDLPVGEIKSDGMSSKGPIFKAPLKLFWIDETGNKEQALGTQIILYPKYPEIRLSGFIKKCAMAPSYLMRPPKEEDRKKYLEHEVNRGMIIGICENSVLAYVGAWDDEISREVKRFSIENPNKKLFSVFFEYYKTVTDSKILLLERLKYINSKGFIRSKRLDKYGVSINYEAQNGAGLTLESEFNIIPNANAEPDFMDWELKARSKSPTTLMTPEPDIGEYSENYVSFITSYSTSKRTDRIDFANRHIVGKKNNKTGLTLSLKGFDTTKNKMIDSEGGLFLINSEGNIAAGWTFAKLLNHWKAKHSKTCFVYYERKKIEDYTLYCFGPKVLLAKGANIDKFLAALANGVIYHDPGCKLELNKGSWRQKKRNQFRVTSKNTYLIYDEYEEISLSDI